MNKSVTKITWGTHFWLWFPSLAVFIALIHAYTSTEKAPITLANVNCAFLGSDCAKLLPGGQQSTGLIYVNPSTNWRQYAKILLDPVTFWGSASTQVPLEDQQMLVDFFSRQLQEKLGEKFEMTQNIGPGVMKVSVAITDAESATPGLRSVSMILPPAHLLSNIQHLATSTFPFAGSAQAEVKITDALTNQTLAAAVDKQLGGGSMAAGLQWLWGDAENAMSDWSARLSNKLSDWTSGTDKP